MRISDWSSDVCSSDLWQRDSCRCRCRCRCFQLPRIQPTLAMPADPEGAAHGCAAFFARAGCPLEKSLHQRKARFALGTKRFSLLPFILTLIKRNEVAEGESTCPSDFAFSAEKAPRSRAFHPLHKTKGQSMPGRSETH